MVVPSFGSGLKSHVHYHILVTDGPAGVPALGPGSAIGCVLAGRPNTMGFHDANVNRWSLVGVCRHMDWIRKSGWLFMTGLALTVGWGALVYVVGDPALYDSVFRAKYILYHRLVVSHGVASVLALLLGPWQWLKRRRWHRPLGYLYLLSLGVGALTGLPMAYMSEGGLQARLGFAVVDVLWLVTAWLALASARQRRFAAHRRWMVRSYALTFGAVVLRLCLYGLQNLGYEFNAIYPYTPWLSWITSLAFGEWILEGETHVNTTRVLRKTRPQGRLAQPAGAGHLGLDAAGHATPVNSAQFHAP